MLDKKINIKYRIQELLPIIKEEFIKYYGEDYKEIIEEKLENCTYLGYYLPDNINHLLTQIYKEKTASLINIFLKENNIEPTEEMQKKYFGLSFNNLDYYIVSNLYKIFTYIDEQQPAEYFEKDVLNILNNIKGHKLEKDSLEYNNLLKELKKLKPSYDEMLNNFSMFKNQYIEYSTYLEKCRILKSTIYKKYEKEYFKQIFEYLSDNDKKIIEELNEKNYLLSTKLDCNKVLFYNNYYTETFLDSFDKKSTEIINDNNSPSWKVQSIYKDRIAYFKKKGIDLGDDYELYKNNEECIKLIPDIEFIEKIKSIRERLSKDEKQEYITSTSLYQEQLQEIKNLNLINEDMSYNCNNLLAGITCINPCIKLENNIPKLHSLLLFGLGRPDKYFDVNFIHECNHLIETELISVSDNNYRIRCGFELMDDFIKKPENTSEITKSRNKREFEMFNEILNELIAQDITTQFHKDNIYLFDKKETSRITGGSSYEKCRFLVEEFFNTYKKEILESRLTGNFEKLFQIIGKENFLELNNLVNDYEKFFEGFKIYNLYDSLKAEVQNELTDYYYSCIARRNEILNNINANYQKQNYSK